MRDRDVVVREGEFFIVPADVEHSPYAENEVQVVSTGATESELTNNEQKWL